MKLNKRILGLETHTYSPEQNTLVLTSGQRLRVPSCTTIKQARDRLFPRGGVLRLAKITVTYPDYDCFRYCNRVYSGSFKDSRELLKFIQGIRSKHKIDTRNLIHKVGNLTGIVRPKISVTFPKLCKKLAQ